MTRTVAQLAVGLLLVALQAHAASADTQERRLSVGASGAFLSLDESSSSASRLAAGGEVRVSYGLTNAVELGAAARFALAKAVELEAANVSGDEGNLFLDLYAPSLAVDARWLGGIELSRRFFRTHPVVGLRAGLLGRWLRNRVLLDDTNTLEVDRYGDDFRVVPFAGLDLGVEHRLSKGFALGLLSSGSIATSGVAEVAVRFEGSWLWY